MEEEKAIKTIPSKRSVETRCGLDFINSGNCNYRKKKTPIEKQSSENGFYNHTLHYKDR